MRIYVGNLQLEFSEGDVREMFSNHGKVDSVAIIRDRSTGRPKGIAFVEMPSNGQAEAAIKALNGQKFHQPPRTLTVHEARPRQSRPAGKVGQRPGALADRLKPLKRGERIRS